MTAKDIVYFYPTDTVWGIGGDIFSSRAQECISEIKKTDDTKPLSVLFTSEQLLVEYIDFSALGIQKNYQELFSKEVTLGVPLHYTNGKIPSYIYQQSNFVFIRFLPKLQSLLPAAVTTTSINLTGTPPLNTLAEIEKFILQYAVDFSTQLIKSKEYIPSGNSSTILKFETDKINVVRQGKRYHELKKICGV